MKKNHGFPYKWGIKMRYVLLVIQVALFLPQWGHASNNVLLPGPKISFSMKDALMKDVIWELEKRSGFVFAYNANDLLKAGKVSVEVKDKDVYEALDICLKGTGLTYVVQQDVIVIKRADAPVQEVKKVTITGRVVDKDSLPLPGVTILLKHTTMGVVTDQNGRCSITIPDVQEPVLIFTFVGMKSREVKYTGNNVINIVLEDDVTEVEEVVVTGMFTRKASSFTGSATTIKGDELLKVGNQNVFQSLKSMEPGLMIFESLEFGSDPNRIPDMQLRGTSVITMGDNSDLDLRGNYENNPNIPLFILDGFEASAVKIFDLDINRVESVTILKDAAAKAIYGSKAANGVVVIETKRNVSKNLRVSYSGSVDVQAPDLSSYNLCNAEEKLEAERIYGMYTPSSRENVDDILRLEKLYMERLSKVKAGVDTDWLAKPLRNGVGHKHSLMIELGDKNIQLVANVSYNDVVGVMKGSDRTNVAGSVFASYRNNKFKFRNELSVNMNKSNDSPYGSFAEYSKLNPYWSPVDEYGQIAKNAGDEEAFYGNPLYNATLNTSLKDKYTEVTDNFEGEYDILQGFKAKVRIGFNRKFSRSDQFYPANHLKFNSEQELQKKGSYQINEGESQTMNYDFSLNFSRQVKELHYLFGFLSYSLDETTYEENIYKAEGFPSDRMNSIFFARQYAEDTKPQGAESTTRNIGVNAVFNYSYDDRLLFDATFRTNASSQFGANQRWGNFWSLGAGWNMHNEKWLRSKEWFSRLKLRASVGSTGSQGNNAYQSLATYNYSEKNYENKLGAYLMGMENKDLKWQKKMDYNVGMDMSVKNNFNLVFDYYQSTTENLLVAFTLPPSTGFTTVQENVGKVRNTGIELSMSYMVLSRPQDRTVLTLSLRAAHNKNRVVKISDSMKAYNEKMDEMAESDSKLVTKYYDGVSMNAIWAVRSLGIDPATGREIYLTKDGVSTYEYRAEDMVVCGDNLPKLRGSFGINLGYKGFGLNVMCMYELGAKMYNETLVDRVENVNMSYAVDKRVLEGRWQKPGDKVRFRSLKQVWDPEKQAYKVDEKTYATSRFVQKKNELNISSINFSYDFFRHAFVKKMGMERLSVAFYMNDVAKLSTIKTERGLSYPFARNYNFSLQMTF